MEKQDTSIIVQRIFMKKKRFLSACRFFQGYLSQNLIEIISAAHQVAQLFVNFCVSILYPFFVSIFPFEEK